MSSTPYFNKAIRSAPMPNANPETFLGSYPLSFTKSNTLGSTMPQPRISIHLPGYHDPNRRPHLLHGPNLHRRSMRAQQKTLPRRCRSLPRDEQSILSITRRMVRRKIQRLKVVVVRLDHRPFGDGIPQPLKHGDDLVHRLDNRMLSANRPPNAGKGYVNKTCFLKRVPLEFRFRKFRAQMSNRKGGDLIPDLRSLYCLLNLLFNEVHFLACLALGFFGSRLQPEVVNLRQHPILACHPSVAKNLPLGLVLHRDSFMSERRTQFRRGALQRRCRVFRQFGDAIHGQIEQGQTE